MYRKREATVVTYIVRPAVFCGNIEDWSSKGAKGFSKIILALTLGAKECLDVLPGHSGRFL